MNAILSNGWLYPGRRFRHWTAIPCRSLLPGIESLAPSVHFVIYLAYFFVRDLARHSLPNRLPVTGGRLKHGSRRGILF